MPIAQNQINRAKAAQDAAAHDGSAQVRLVAGPGTGKSSTIEERVAWLIGQGIQPATIQCISFTRASALDLRKRIHNYCLANGQPTGIQVSVSTLHSLALRTLRAAGLLHAYPTDPLILDTWELETVFDEEFGHQVGIGKRRRKEIRREHEAFWGTGNWGPPNYIPPNPAISAPERAQFIAFHGPRSQCYSCVLPGEIVRQCVSHIAAGNLNPVALLNITHLVVDEYQDLNPMDLQFVDAVIARGARIFVAGDDDQSIYSFRYASPLGIQNFAVNYPQAGSHVLADCFRCTPSILAASQQLIAAHPPPNRIQKNVTSLYTKATPPIIGIVHRWRFASGIAEARSIAKSCLDLTTAGVNPRDVLILVSDQRTQLPILVNELQKSGVDFEPPKAEGFLDSGPGRLVLAILRIVCSQNDYVAHRILLGIRPGVGIGTSSTITDKVIANNLNYRAIFYQTIPTGVFTTRETRAINDARTVCSHIQAWVPTDTLAFRLSAITSIVQGVFDPVAARSWQTYSASLPVGISLQELRDLLWADTDEQQTKVLEDVYGRLQLPQPPQGVLPPRVRIMSMHGAKGLSAKIVFIPGLEDDILPGPWRQPYAGLVLEGARLLYVSITRARATCILSYARTRKVLGQFRKQPPSRFTLSVGGSFVTRTHGLTNAEVQSIQSQLAAL